MSVHLPGLLDRLSGRAIPSGQGAGRPAIEQLKDSIARDLELLLNTRVGPAPARIKACPAARASVLHFGLRDFAAYSLSSSEDRVAICACLKETIERHEPRLKNVGAALAPGAGAVNRLHVVIEAVLQAEDGAEAVQFDAVLQPSSLHVSIGRSGRPPRS